MSASRPSRRQCIAPGGAMLPTAHARSFAAPLAMSEYIAAEVFGEGAMSSSCPVSPAHAMRGAQSLNGCRTAIACSQQVRGFAGLAPSNKFGTPPRPKPRYGRPI